jgi:hypothetical protein
MRHPRFQQALSFSTPDRIDLLCPEIDACHIFS